MVYLYFTFIINLIVNLMNIPHHHEIIFFWSSEHITLPSTWVNSTFGVHFFINGVLFIIVYDPCNTK